MGKFKNAANNVKAVGELLSLAVKLSFSILLIAPFLYLSEKVLGRTPKWAQIPQQPWSDIFCYESGKGQDGKDYIEIGAANCGTDEMTYPVAKDFIAEISCRYHMMMKIECSDSASALYDLFLSEYREEQLFIDSAKGEIFVICDDIKPAFNLMGSLSEYSYHFAVTVFGSPIGADSLQTAKQFMQNKNSLLHIECQKQHDKIILYFDDNAFSEADLLKSLKASCENHNRRFMTDEEMIALYP